MFLDIDGNRVFTLSFGQGPRTILAHGGWISNVEDWITTLAPLSTTWRTVTYDHRGAGLTRVPVDRISPQALVDDVFRVMDALDIERCVLAGFSRGTVTALRAVLAQPERFDGLVLMNGCGEVQSPDLAVRPRPAPSTWPGATHAERMRWFIERCTPEPDIEHIRRWGEYVLARLAASPAHLGIEEIKLGNLVDRGWPVGVAIKSRNRQLRLLVEEAFRRLHASGEMLAIFRQNKLTLTTA